LEEEEKEAGNHVSRHKTQGKNAEKKSEEK